ncbi:MAG TPA: MBL fold metallo-hydrolase [Burkholderiaceae bacterium]|nr:MBL fold metallo-hydrolase [Burkholderiaceae bacterium]
MHVQATGAGLMGLYDSVDPLVRDKVELSYDVSKQASVRFFEKLFYSSNACDPGLQSCVIELATDEPRAFCLTTPQLLKSRNSVRVTAPFRDPVWDRLCGGEGAESCGDLMEQLRPHVTDPDALAALLDTALAPRVTHPDAEPPQDMRVRYFGHACVLVQGAGISVLIDPLVSYPGESSLDPFTFDDLPQRIDYVLITHPHQDHVVIEALLRLRHRVGHVVVGRAGGGSLGDVSLRLCLEHCGFRSVIELGEYEEIHFPGGRIIGAPFYGEHADLDIRSKVVHAIEMNGKSCILFADSNPPAPEFYAPLRAMLGHVDCLFLGMECVGAPASWLYGPMLKRTLTRGEDQSRRLDGCNGDKALKMHEYFSPKRLYIYAMGAEPWITHITSIVYSEDLVQFKEARRVERTVQSAGGHAELLFGKHEFRP